MATDSQRTHGADTKTPGLEGSCRICGRSAPCSDEQLVALRTQLAAERSARAALEAENQRLNDVEEVLRWYMNGDIEAMADDALREKGLLAAAATPAAEARGAEGE